MEKCGKASRLRCRAARLVKLRRRKATRDKGGHMKYARPLVVAVVFASCLSWTGTMAAAADRWREATFPPPNAGLLVFTITEDGNPACASYDGRNCLWGQKMSDIDFARVKPLICGAAHRTLYGTTGFEDPKHWCNLARRGPSASAPPIQPGSQSPPAAPRPRVSGREAPFGRPMYKNTPARLDFCQQFGQNCGQAAADQYCRIKGYERATKFESEPATPTRVIGSGQECKGSRCAGFKFIVCFTSAQGPGKGEDWPPQM